MEMLDFYKKVFKELKLQGEEPHLHETYSGRGMYGKTTVGISGDFFEDALQEAFYMVAAEQLDDEAARSSIETTPFTYLDCLQDIIEVANKHYPRRKDNMGLGSIWYY